MFKVKIWGSWPWVFSIVDSTGLSVFNGKRVGQTSVAPTSFLHGTWGVPGTWLSVQVMHPEWGRAGRKSVREGRTGPNLLQIFQIRQRKECVTA